LVVEREAITGGVDAQRGDVELLYLVDGRATETVTVAVAPRERLPTARQMLARVAARTQAVGVGRPKVSCRQA